MLRKMLRNRKKLINEEVQINMITPETQITHFKNLYQNCSEDTEQLETNKDLSTTAAEDEYDITLNDVKRAIMNSKNRKAPGLDGIINEMLKYGGPNIQHEITTLFKKNHE